MMVQTMEMPLTSLNKIGIKYEHTLHYQLSPEELIQDTLRIGEGKLSDTGALVIRTGEFTGRSPKDKFTVRDVLTEKAVNWNEFNIPLAPENYDLAFDSVRAYINQLPELWVRDCFACADPRYRMSIRVIAEKPWTSLFAHNMFIRPNDHELESFDPEWHIMAVPGLKLDPAKCGVRQHNASIISFKHKIILVAGSGYTGETKKGIFSVLNFILPHSKNVLSMHCSANMGNDGDTALFFGLSGTGKTTLSADPLRHLIGDDEHGWTEDNIFNFEGGCYAKTIDLSEEKEPDIFNAIRPGALVENTEFFPKSNRINFEGKSITENTRVSYPIHFINNAVEPSVGNIPTNIFFLTCDASGVLPPISKLSPAQAMYQFISGYTAKVAGTEADVTEPKATFSACFGAPFIPLHPGKYAAMLGEKLRKHKVNVWLINTGWTGGAYGVGSRIRLSFTRAMISAVLSNKLDNIGFHEFPVFGFSVPDTCPGVPTEILDPKNTWKNPEAYDMKLKQLAAEFNKNFSKYANEVDAEIRAAAPLI